MHAPTALALFGSRFLSLLLTFATTPSLVSAQDLPPLGTPGKTMPLPAESRLSLQDHLPRPHVFADPDWFQWGGSVVQADDGKYHMFYARWRRQNPRGMKGWLYESQIARAVADRPEGPFRHVDVVLEGFGDPQPARWDAINAHNPCITRMRDPQSGRERYYLYFIANRDDDSTKDMGDRNDWWDHIINQRIGVAVADSLTGPWTRFPRPIITPPTGPLRHYLVNPGVCQLPDGRFLLVLKGRNDGPNHGQMIHGWALSDRPEGPFVAQDSLLFPASMRAEDPCVWVEGKWVYAAVKDWNGQVSGTAGISFVRGKMRGNSIKWEVPPNNSISSRQLAWDDGERTALAHLERPFVLRNADGVPTHLYAACAVENPYVKDHSQPSLHLPFNVCLPLAPAVAAPPKKPNVLIIYADDLGFGDLGCYNPNSKIPTPNLNQFASEGMRFTDGHSSSGICTPSRYALLTGRYHWRDFHGIVGPMGGSVFAPERLTLPEMMQQSGYHTAAIGKWHLGFGWDAIKQGDKYNWDLPIPDGPLAHGFDQYFGDAVINFPPYAWIENDRMLQIPDTVRDTTKWKKIKEGGWECRPGPAYSGWDPYQNIPTTIKRGIDFIKAQADTEEPFFLYFAFPSPHAPIIPNDKFDGMSQAGPYGDFVVETDHAIGKLLRALEESGQADNTVVIFSADNGPEKYAYARDQKFDHWSATPLRGLKRDIYEGGHHVPFVVRYPGVTTAGSTSDALVSQIDIMATLAAIVRFQLPSQNAAEDSFNLMPLLKGRTDPVRHSLVHNTNKDAYAVRSGDWLLVDHKHGYMSGRNQRWESKHKYAADDDLPVELYNLKKDIGQRVNLATRRADKVVELSELLNTTRMQTSTAPRLQVASDWPSHLGDNQRRGAVDVGPPATLQMQWIHTAQRAPEPAWGKPADGSFWQRLESLHARVQFDQVFAPIFVGDRIYYGSSADGSLRCLNAANGQQRWIYHAEAPIRLAPTVLGSRIFFGADDGFAYCLSALTGELQWRTLLAPSSRRIPSNGKLVSAWPVRTGVVVDGEQLYATCGIFPNYGCWAAQLNTATGEVQWKAELNQGLSPQGYLLLSENKLFVPSGRTTPFVLSRTDGRYLGQFGGAGGAYALLTDADENAELLSGPGNQGELNLSPASSRERIATFAGLRMVVDGNISYLQSQTQIVAMDRTAFKLDREKGSLWAIASTHNDAMVLGGDVLWAAGLGELAAYEAATGKLLNTLKVPSKQRILAIAVGKNQVVVSTAGGEMISFGMQTPRIAGESSVEQIRRPELRPDGLILHVDVTPQSLLQIQAQRPTSVVVVAAAHVKLKELHRAAQSLRTSAPQVFVEQILPASALDHFADGIANQVVAHPIQPGPAPARYAHLLVPTSSFLGAWSHPYADAGNTACSNDPIRTTDLQLQWFGGPGAQPMIDRHLRTSPPISAGGRLFIPGDDSLIAIDVFNGSVLWRKDLPDWTRVGVPYDAGYMAVGASEIFTATPSQAIALDVRSGTATRSFQLPNSVMLEEGTGELDWGWLALSDQTLLGSATPKAAARRQQSRDDVVEQYGEHRPLVYSQVLLGFGLESCAAPQNQSDWLYQSKGAILNTSLAADDGNLIFLESTSAEALTSSGRANLHQFFASGEQHLVCMDNINGIEKWRVPYPDQAERHVIYLCYSDGKILTVGSFNRDNRIWYSVRVWSADDGSLLWQAEHQNNRPGVGGDHGEQVHHPVIQGSRIIAEPAIYDFNTGQRLDQITTESGSIGVPRRGGCGTISASANALFYRDGCPTARQFSIPADGSNADLKPQVNPLTSTTRPGCWINILPVAGLVVIPEASSGCVCAYPIQTCLALSPK